MLRFDLQAINHADHNIGKVVQVIGPVLDVEFEAEHLPELYNALEITGTRAGRHADPASRSRCSSTSAATRCARSPCRRPTASMRGMEVVDTGAPITVPVGAPALGRILNVLGEPVDNGAADPEGCAALADPPQAPRLRQPRAEDGNLRDGHQGRRPHRPVREGRKDRSLRRRRRRQDGRHSWS